MTPQQVGTCVDFTVLMQRLAALVGCEVGLMCDPSPLVPMSDRWIAHMGGRLFGKGGTAEEAVKDLLREASADEWWVEAAPSCSS